MGCLPACCGGGAAVEPAEFNPLKANRKCRDLFCILLFAVYWVGMVLVFVIGLQFGQPERLVFATDFNGDTCGVSSETTEGLADKKYVYYPRIDQDVQEGLSGGAAWEDISFYGVCLDECPTPLPNNAGHDYVCNYETEELVKEDMLILYDQVSDQYEDRIARALFIAADFETATAIPLGFAGGKYTTGCWPIDIPTSNLLYRCFWELDENLNTTEICTYPDDTEEYYDLKYKYEDEGHTFPEGGIASNKKQGEYWFPNENCKTKMAITITEAIAPANDNPLLDQLESYVSIIRRMYSDLETTSMYIFLIGGIGTTVFAFLFLELMQMFAGFITWLTVTLVVFLSAAMTAFCAFKGGVVTNDDISVLEDKFSGAVTDISGELELEAKMDADNQGLYEILFYILAVVTVVLFVMVLFFRKKIQITVEIIREASNAIQTMPLLVFFPMIPFIWSLINLGYFVVSTSYLLTAGDITSGLLNITDAIDTAAADFSSETGVNVTDVNGTDVDLSALLPLNFATVDSDDALFYMMWYNLFGFLWTNQLIQAISMCTIAGAISRWYWARSKTCTNDNDAMGKFPIAQSLKYCFRYHFGSLLFGAFLVAVVQLLRAILIYIDHQTKELQNKNILIKILMKVLHCCLWCLEKCMKFITKNSYIIISMTGCSFGSACVRSFKLIFANLGQISVVQTVSAFVLTLAKVAMCVGCGVLMFMYVENNEDYSAYGESPLNYPIIPPLVTMMLAYFVASTFLNVFDLCIDTILICFCLDREKNAASGEFYMSDGLKKLIGKYKIEEKKSEKKETEKPPAGE
jgi:choline transporter-like protein 2/4/5